MCVCVHVHPHLCSVHTCLLLRCRCLYPRYCGSWILHHQLQRLAWKHSHTNTHTVHTHRLTHPLPKPKQWSIIRIHILLWATSVPLLRKNWSQNRLLTVNCRTVRRPLTTRKRPLWTHAFNRPTIRVNGGSVWERSDLALDLWHRSFLNGSGHNGGFVEAIIVIVVVFPVIEGELSGVSQLRVFAPKFPLNCN